MFLSVGGFQGWGGVEKTHSRSEAGGSGNGWGVYVCVWENRGFVSARLWDVHKWVDMDRAKDRDSAQTAGSLFKKLNKQELQKIK